MRLDPINTPRDLIIMPGTRKPWVTSIKLFQDRGVAMDATWVNFSNVIDAGTMASVIPMHGGQGPAKGVFQRCSGPAPNLAAELRRCIRPTYMQSVTFD